MIDILNLKWMKSKHKFITNILNYKMMQSLSITKTPSKSSNSSLNKPRLKGKLRRIKNKN